jgi:hypothetical protein
MTAHYTTIYRKDSGEIVSTGLFICEEEMVDINFAIRIDQYGGQDHDAIDARPIRKPSMSRSSTGKRRS